MPDDLTVDDVGDGAVTIFTSDAFRRTSRTTLDEERVEHLIRELGGVPAPDMQQRRATTDSNSSGINYCPCCGEELDDGVTGFDAGERECANCGPIHIEFWPAE